MNMAALKSIERKAEKRFMHMWHENRPIAEKATASKAGNISEEYLHQSAK